MQQIFASLLDRWREGGIALHGPINVFDDAVVRRVIQQVFVEFVGQYRLQKYPKRLSTSLWVLRIDGEYTLVDETLWIP